MLATERSVTEMSLSISLVGPLHGGRHQVASCQIVGIIMIRLLYGYVYGRRWCVSSGLGGHC